jgi:hypothetical protein
MTLDAFISLEIIETLENFINKVRPPEEIREKLDIAYKLDNQSVIVFELRPNWRNPENKTESQIAKATFVKTKKHRKVSLEMR